LSGVLYVKYQDMEYQISIPFDLETN
jgi:hypothetical protein